MEQGGYGQSGELGAAVSHYMEPERPAANAGHPKDAYRDRFPAMLPEIVEVFFTGEAIKMRYGAVQEHFSVNWLRGLDSNQQPSAYEADELPFAPPHNCYEHPW